MHIFWVGRTPRGEAADEPMRYPKYTSGGLMREHRQVFGLDPAHGGGSSYKQVVLPELASEGIEATPERHRGTKGRAPKKPHHRVAKLSLAEMQRAFRYGQGKHICVVIAGLTKYLPVAPFEMPNFTDLARSMVATQAGDSAVRKASPKGVIGASAASAPGSAGAAGAPGSGGAAALWIPAKQAE